MRALAVLPIAVALGAWDPCEPPAPPGAAATGQTPAQVQRLNIELKLAGCVAAHAPRVMRQGRLRAKALVREACVDEAAASGAMTGAQAAALADQLVDQEIDFLTKCQD